MKQVKLHEAIVDVAIAMLQVSVPLGIVVTLFWNAFLSQYFGVEHIKVWHGIIVVFLLKLCFAFSYSIECPRSDDSEKTGSQE